MKNTSKDLDLWLWSHSWKRYHLLANHHLFISMPSFLLLSWALVKLNFSRLWWLFKEYEKLAAFLLQGSEMDLLNPILVAKAHLFFVTVVRSYQDSAECTLWRHTQPQVLVAPLETCQTFNWQSVLDYYHLYMIAQLLKNVRDTLDWCTKETSCNI